MREAMMRFKAAIMRDPGGYEWTYRELHPRNRSEDAMLNRLRLHRRTMPAFVEISENSEFLYDPFAEEPALFRIVAQLEESEDAILAFANRYGDMEPRTGQPQMVSSSLLRWRLLINEMKRDVEIAERLSNAHRLGVSTPKRTAAAVRFIKEMASHVPTFLSAGADGDRLRIDNVCTNLVDAMKIQLAIAVVEQKQYRDCQHCSKPFEVTPQINRSDRLFCSDNCRVKAYQRRKKQVIELRNQGESLRAIVKKSGSDMETVKKWIAESEAKEKSGDEKTQGQR